MKIKFNNEYQFRDLKSYSWTTHIVTLKGLKLDEEDQNDLSETEEAAEPYQEYIRPGLLSGFKIYHDDEETVIENYSDFIYFYSTQTPTNYCISFTDIQGNEEKESQVVDESEFTPIIIPPSEIEKLNADVEYLSMMMNIEL